MSGEWHSYDIADIYELSDSLGEISCYIQVLQVFHLSGSELLGFKPILCKKLMYVTIRNLRKLTYDMQR